MTGGRKTSDGLRVLVTESDLRKTVSRLAEALNRDYAGKQPVLVGVLKGGFVFLADLVRQLSFPAEIDFIQVASYAAGTESTGSLRLLSGLHTDIRGRDVLVVEDIVDSGLTLSYLLRYLRRRRPASLRVCALLTKETGVPLPLTIDYLGLTIPDVFAVGYGLDHAEHYRQLPDLRVLEV